MKAVRRIRDHARAAAPHAVRAPLDLIYAYKGRHIERFAMMIGYNRSGSSLLGQMLNAHPEIVIAHEFYMLRTLRSLRFVPTPSARGRAARLVLEGDRRARRGAGYGSSGYSYVLNGASQGEYSRLRVIGDKGPVSAVEDLSRWGDKWLQYLRRRVRAPIRALFTVRNPYDVIASRRLNRLRDIHGADIPPLRDYAPRDADLPPVDDESVDWFIELTDNLSRALPMFAEGELTATRYEEFIADPREALRRICAFYGVDCGDDYLDACAAFAQPPQRRPTRLKARWSVGQKTRVAAAIAKNRWLAGYDFDS